MNESPPKKRNPAPVAETGNGADENQLAGVTVPPTGFTRKEFAGTIGVSTRTIARYLADGKLIVSRTIGGQPRIHGVKELPIKGAKS